MSGERTVRERLEAKGFSIAPSPIPSCQYVTGPNGEIYGPLTCSEAVERFLSDDEEDGDAR